MGQILSLNWVRLSDSNFWSNNFYDDELCLVPPYILSFNPSSLEYIHSKTDEAHTLWTAAVMQVKWASKKLFDFFLTQIKVSLVLHDIL